MRLIRILGSSLIVVLGGYLVLVFVLGPLIRRAPEGPHQPDGEILRDFRQSLSRDAILPVYDPAFIGAEQADLRADELVMGVEIEGEARAYPVGFLRFREMVNDRIGPIPFLVTW
jgi:hypothetical protein